MLFIPVRILTYWIVANVVLLLRFPRTDKRVQRCYLIWEEKVPRWALVKTPLWLMFRHGWMPKSYKKKKISSLHVWIVRWHNAESTNSLLRSKFQCFSRQISSMLHTNRCFENFFRSAHIQLRLFRSIWHVPVHEMSFSGSPAALFACYCSCWSRCWNICLAFPHFKTLGFEHLKQIWARKLFWVKCVVPRLLTSIFIPFPKHLTSHVNQLWMGLKWYF